MFLMRAQIHYVGKWEGVGPWKWRVFWDLWNGIEPIGERHLGPINSYTNVSIAEYPNILIICSTIWYDQVLFAAFYALSWPVLFFLLILLLPLLYTWRHSYFFLSFLYNYFLIIPMLLIFSSNALLKVYCSSRWIWLKVYSFERSFLKVEAWMYSKFCLPPFSESQRFLVHWLTIWTAIANGAHSISPALNFLLQLAKISKCAMNKIDISSQWRRDVIIISTSIGRGAMNAFRTCARGIITAFG